MSGNERRTPTDRPSRPGRRGVLAIVALVVLAVAIVVGFAVRNGEDGRAAAVTGTRSTAPAESSPSTGPTGSPAPTGEAVTPGPGSIDALPTSLPQVGLTETAAVGDGVTVAVASVERFEGEGVGPGNVSGPALRVTVRLTNGTADAVSLDAVSVNAGVGDDVVPAPELNDVSRAPFSRSVAPGSTAEGTYTFSLPSGATGPVVIDVGYRPGAPLVLFVGPVA